MKVLPRTAPAALAVGALLTGCGREGPRTVLVVSLDTSRADAVTFHDESVTPRLARLAERGTVFEQAISGSSWTLPSHAQLFTGQPPAMHAVLDDDVIIDPATPTLPELFAADGFFTAGVYSGLYLAGFFGFERGFEEYANAIQGGAELEARFEHLAQGGEREAGAVWKSLDVQSHRDISSTRIVEQAERLLRAARGEDLFLFTHFFDPHYDYVPPAPYDARFDPDYAGDVTGEDFHDLVFDADQRPLPLSDADRRHVQALYLGELAWTDEHVGQVLDLLRADGRLDDAWIVVVGDHGEEFYEHGSWGHRATLYEEQLRVPFLVVPPEGLFPDAPSASELQVTLSDVAPTLLEGLGLEVPETVVGRSLLPVLQGGALAPEPALSSLRSRPRTELVEGRLEAEHLLMDSYRTGDQKLIRRVLVAGGEPRVTEVLYYDLEDDPLEQRPIADPEHPRLRALYEALEAEYARLNAAYDAVPHASLADRSSAGKNWLTSQAEALAALGYAENVEGEQGDGLTLPWGLRPMPPVPLPE